jgi:thermitase
MIDRRSLLLAALSTLPLMALPSLAHAERAKRIVFALERPPLARSAESSIADATRVTGLPLLSIPGGPNPTAAARRLAERRGIAWAETDSTYRALGSADPRRRNQWALDAIHAERGWDLAGLGRIPSLSGPPIAIVDTGADSSHEDLRGRIRACAASSSGRVREGICDDRDGHGTHVAGTAAAATGNGIGIAGVAATSPLLICRALSAGGAGSGSDVAACIAWAANRGAKVISLSLGGPDSRTMRAAVTAATSAGAVVVAAAGNDGTSEVSFPAGYAGVVSVAATGPDGRRAAFSNSNRDVEIAAPGVDILSLAPGNRYRTMSGTSMATPHVAGAAALLWAGLPHPTAASVRAALDRSTRDAGPRGRDRDYGFGVLDLADLAL